MLRGLGYTAASFLIFFARARQVRAAERWQVLSPVGVTGCAVAVWVYGELRAAPHHHLSVPFGQSRGQSHRATTSRSVTVTPHTTQVCALHELCSRAHLSYFTALYSFCKQ